MRFLRHYKPEDNETLTEMLRDENIPFLEMIFEEHPTMILEEDKEIIGFFTLRVQHNYPMLHHFCIKRKYRSFKTALFLVKCLKKVIKELGFDKVFIFSDKDYLSKMIEWAFHVKPYAETKDRVWYFATI